MNNRLPTIATLGSHTALQILKGAKDEGFGTLIVCVTERVGFYKRFSFIGEIVELKNYSNFSVVEKKLANHNVILIPHGSFVAYLGKEGNKNISIPYFGNKAVLDWEGNRVKQAKWLLNASVPMPAQYTKTSKRFPVIVKSFGAAGGSGYFFAKDNREFQQKFKIFKASEYVIQEYIVGVTMYFHYFYSPLTKKIELMSIDRRYETNADALGRIPQSAQQGLGLSPSYVVVGNSPLVVRESLLPEVYELGERVVATSREIIDGRGLFGPFCLETIITPDLRIYVMEISCRIVAGTNLFTHGSAYSYLIYDEPMSTGRRIAREIKLAIKQKKLYRLLS